MHFSILDQFQRHHLFAIEVSWSFDIGSPFSRHVNCPGRSRGLRSYPWSGWLSATKNLINWYPASFDYAHKRLLIWTKWGQAREKSSWGNLEIIGTMHTAATLLVYNDRATTFIVHIGNLWFRWKFYCWNHTRSAVGGKVDFGDHLIIMKVAAFISRLYALFWDLQLFTSLDSLYFPIMSRFARILTEFRTGISWATFSKMVWSSNGDRFLLLNLKEGCNVQCIPRFVTWVSFLALLI